VLLSEVIGNAIAYSNKACTVDVRVHPIHRTIHIDIQDHGCGIPTDDMPRLFEKYMRGKNARLHKPDGNGLGLYICKGIADGMNGSIAVESIEDVGTKVSITLPMA
jgi:signal transduction histidine kinase